MITFHFTCGEMKICSATGKSQNIIKVIVGELTRNYSIPVTSLLQCHLSESNLITGGIYVYFIIAMYNLIYSFIYIRIVPVIFLLSLMPSESCM